MDERMLIAMPGQDIDSAAPQALQQALAARRRCRRRGCLDIRIAAGRRPRIYSRQVEITAQSLPAGWKPRRRVRPRPIEPVQQIADFNAGIRVESVAGAARGPQNRGKTAGVARMSLI